MFQKKLLVIIMLQTPKATLCGLLVVSCFISAASAQPIHLQGTMEANPSPLVINQPDGTTFTGYFRGNRENSYYTDSLGVPIIKSENGEWNWGRWQDEKLVSTGIPARNLGTKEQVMDLISKSTKADNPDDSTNGTTKQAKKYELTIDNNGAMELDGFRVLVNNNQLVYANVEDGFLVPTLSLIHI